MRRYFSDMAESWKEWEMDVEEVVPPAPDAVLATFTSRLVGEDSGVPVAARRTAIVTVVDGKILRARTYPTREEALAAAGRSS